MKFFCSLLLSISVWCSPICADAPGSSPTKEQHQAPVEKKPETQLIDSHEDKSAPSSEEVTDSYQSAFSRMLLSLLGLIALLILTVFFLKRIGKGKFGWGSDKTIEILERRALSPKTVLYCVKIQGKKVLLSESQLEVRALTTLDTAEE